MMKKTRSSVRKWRSACFLMETEMGDCSKTDRERRGRLYIKQACEGTFVKGRQIEKYQYLHHLLFSLSKTAIFKSRNLNSTQPDSHKNTAQDNLSQESKEQKSNRHPQQWISPLPQALPNVTTSTPSSTLPSSLVSSTAKSSY